MSVWYKISQIWNIRQYLSVEDSRTVVHAHITSLLDCNNSLLSGISDALIKMLQRIQNAPAKLIYRASKHDQVTEMLRKLHWLPIKKRIEFKVMLITYKVIHDKDPQYLKHILNWYNPQKNLRSGNKKQLEKFSGPMSRHTVIVNLLLPQNVGTTYLCE